MKHPASSLKLSKNKQRIWESQAILLKHATAKLLKFILEN